MKLGSEVGSLYACMAGNLIAVKYTYSGKSMFTKIFCVLTKILACKLKYLNAGNHKTQDKTQWVLLVAGSLFD